VDRFRRRPFLVAGNLGVAAILTPLYAVRDRHDIWIIYLVAALYGLSFLAINAALNGLIKEVVPPDLLAEANGALQTVKQGLRLVGPILGAGLYTAVGGWAVASVGVVGFVLAASVIALLRVPEERPEPGEMRWLAEVTAGVRYALTQPALRRTTIGTSIGIFLLGFIETLVFAYVDEGLHRGPAFVGVIVTIQGIGGLLGGLGAARVVRRLGEVGTVGVGVLAFAPTCLLLAVPSLWTAFPAAIFCGLAIPITIVGFNTLMQRLTPHELLGRVSAATDALISGPQAAAIALSAVLVSVVDFRLLFLLMAIGLAGAGLYVFLGRALTGPSASAVDAGGVDLVEPLTHLDDGRVGQR